MPRDLSPEAYAFQVDLRGLVDLLSQHLYSSPQVYIREPCRTRWTRRPPTGHRPVWSGRDPDRHRRRWAYVSDSGIGLTEADAHQFLATIGHSSKRDELAGAGREFLGQFGVGLLACFTVSDQIRVGAGG
jgi:molecular chaperone HtpG